MNSIESKVKQFQHEVDGWKRNLEFIMEENTYLKTRLADVLKAVSSDEDILTAAEQYQNNFVREDETIHLLRGDIADFDKLLVKEIYQDGKVIDEVMRKQKKLSAEIKNSIGEFNKLKFDFNNYLGEVL